ncbi:unnamed protein product, partial [Polarella glacialis]
MASGSLPHDRQQQQQQQQEQQQEQEQQQQQPMASFLGHWPMPTGRQRRGRSRIVLCLASLLGGSVWSSQRNVSWVSGDGWHTNLVVARRAAVMAPLIFSQLPSPAVADGGSALHVSRPEEGSELYSFDIPAGLALKAIQPKSFYAGQQELPGLSFRLE